MDINIYAHVFLRVDFCGAFCG